MSTRKSRPSICVTGMGVVTSLGKGVAENWAALTRGRSGIAAIQRFETKGLRSTIGGTIDFDGLGALPVPVRTGRLADLALEEALAQAHMPKDAAPHLFVGLPPGELSWAQRFQLAAEKASGGTISYDELIPACDDGAHRAYHEMVLSGAIAARLADRLGTREAPVIVNTACATGGTAIQLAVESIRRGDTGIAIAIASDASIVADTLVRFSLLAALSMSNETPAGACKPFSLNRDGFVMGEGAAALVLEDYETAKARGREALGFVIGAGERADDYHLTRSSPDGTAVVGAMTTAIADSGLAPEEIHYVNAHGTGTGENDRIEGTSLAKVFGSFEAAPPVSSNKSMIGHTMSAAGLIEAVFSLLTIRHGVIPPTINYNVPDPALPLDVVPNAARKAKVENVLSNSFGFGGQNVSLVFSNRPH